MGAETLQRGKQLLVGCLVVGAMLLGSVLLAKLAVSVLGYSVGDGSRAYSATLIGSVPTDMLDGGYSGGLPSDCYTGGLISNAARSHLQVRMWAVTQAQQRLQHSFARYEPVARAVDEQLDRRDRSLCRRPEVAGGWTTGSTCSGVRYILRRVAPGGTPSASLPLAADEPAAGLAVTSFAIRQPMTGEVALSSTAAFRARTSIPNRAFAHSIATDLGGRLAWHCGTLRPDPAEIWPVRIVAGGTNVLLGADRYYSTGDDFLWESDLAGNTVRATKIDAINALPACRGWEPVCVF
jgi:hypothetical protein